MKFFGEGLKSLVCLKTLTIIMNNNINIRKNPENMKFLAEGIKNLVGLEELSLSF